MLTKRLSQRTLLPLIATLVFAGTACAHGEHKAQPRAEPALPEYSLLSPYHLPHVMRELRHHADDFGLNEEQRRTLARLHDEEARPALQPRLREAQRLEREIARAVMEGQEKASYAAKLDRLQQVKREAADLHIDCVQRVRGVLTPEQYARLMVRVLAR